MADIFTLRSGATAHPEDSVLQLPTDLVSASGVVDLSTHFAVSAQTVPDMTVKAATGRAFVKGSSSNAYPVRSDGSVNATITANGSGNSRIDAVVLYIDLSAVPSTDADNVAKLYVVAGTPAGSPVAPSDADIQTAIGASNPFLRLANVTVASGATSITNANIADARVQVTLNIAKIVGDLILPTGGNVQVGSADPKRGFYIPAQSLLAATTNGAAPAQVETSTNKVNYKALDFDASTQEYAHFGIPSPKFWNASTVKATFYWTAASGSGNVIWGLQGLACSDDDALDQAFGTAQEITDALIAAGDVHVSSQTAEVTVAGTPVAGDWVIFRVYRKAADGGDTLGVDARLLGVKIEFTMGQYDDA